MKLKRAAISALVLASLSAPAAAGAQADPGAQADTRAERDDVRRRRADVSAELDVLTATDAQIGTELDALDDAIAAQQSALAEAESDRVDAERAVDEAGSDLRTARRDVEVLEAAIREMAVASYIHPPSADLVQSLEAMSFSDALLQRAYLDARAKRDVGLLDLLERAEATAASRAAALEAAAAEAERAASAAAAALDGLRSEQAEQKQFAARLRERIDASLAEAAVLADLDAELAATIQAEQAALLARIPAPSVPAEPTGPAAAATTPTAPAPPGTTAPRPTPTAPPTTAPRPVRPPPRPPRAPDAPPLRTVQGITVHADIAGDVDALLTAARSAGIPLSGWGYRSGDRQVQLRQQNCGPTSYDVWLKPASLCSPPTAVPGRSLHEQGRAIDFTHNGSTITSRSSAAFRWLARNASSYGLFNLPSEPWHWSTSGG